MIAPVAQYIDNLNAYPVEDEIAIVWQIPEESTKEVLSEQTYVCNRSINEHHPKSTEDILLESSCITNFLNGLDALDTILPSARKSLDKVSESHFKEEFSKVLSVVAMNDLACHVEYDEQDDCVFLYTSVDGKKIFFNFFFDGCNIEAQINVSSEQSYSSIDGTVYECIEKLYGEVGRSGEFISSKAAA